MPGKIFCVDWESVRASAATSPPAAYGAALSAADGSARSAAAPDPYADDPFFKLPVIRTWNACIGRQGHELHYMDGYMEAAIELASAVIDKQMYEKRDTLVLPILYNARHAVELTLKFAVDRLVAARLIQHSGKRNHNIKAYWERLNAASLGDEKLLQTIRALKPFIESLSRIDSDGQELRYHLNRSGTPSLAGYSLANLEVIRASLSDLSKILSTLRYRTLEFIDEREAGTYTNRCSRSDLFTIAQLLPPHECWGQPSFDELKEAIKARFNLGSRQFSLALGVIQSKRETKALLGVETPLVYISDDEVVWIVEQWRRLHPQEEETDDGLGIDPFDPATIDAILEYSATKSEVVADIAGRITADKVAEVDAMFYLARDRVLSEYYERCIEIAQKEFLATGDTKEKIAHLMEKTNFLRCLEDAARKLGRLTLADRLSKM